MINIVDKRQCCGCTACVQKCPKHCIFLYEDGEGFLYPKIDINPLAELSQCILDSSNGSIINVI